MRLVIADDHPIVLNGLEELLRRAGHSVVAAVGAGDQALAQIKSQAPDAAILDVNMPGMTGVKVLQSLRESGIETPIILLMGSLEDQVLVAAVEAGVNGIVLKESATEKLLYCLEIVATGERWLEREAMTRALAAMARLRQDAKLTRRELQIISLVGQGRRNREIAELLKMSEGTVKAHLRSIFEKVGVENRAQLALRAKDLARS